MRLCHAVGKIVLSRRIAVGLVMCIAVVTAVTQVLHQSCRRIAQMLRDRARFIIFNHGARCVISRVRGIAFGSNRQIQRCFGQGEFAFRTAQPLVGFARVQRNAQRARVGKPYVLRGHAHYPAPHIQRVGAAIEHPAQPV